MCLAAAASPSHQVYRDVWAPLPASQRRALLALDLKFKSSQGHGNTGPSPSPPVPYCSTVPRKPRVCVGRPRPATVIIHTEHAEGGSIASCYLREGRRWYVTRSVERGCFARLGDQVCGSNLSSLFTLRLPPDRHHLLCFRKRNWFFFLVNFVPLLLTGKVTFIVRCINVNLAAMKLSSFFLLLSWGPSG